MQHSNQAEAKASLRKTLRVQRANFEQTQAVIQGLAAQLENLVIRLEPQVIAGYLPYGNEPNIEEFLRKQIQSGRQVLMPLSQSDGSLRWVNWLGEKRAPGIFKFFEAEGAPAELATADLVLVPALAADKFGNRLGKGKGFYDRALGHQPCQTAAIVFDHEIQPNLPVEEHDEPVNFVVTEKRLLASG